MNNANKCSVSVRPFLEARGKQRGTDSQHIGPGTSLGTCVFDGLLTCRRWKLFWVYPTSVSPSFLFSALKHKNRWEGKLCDNFWGNTGSRSEKKKTKIKCWSTKLADVCTQQITVTLVTAQQKRK